MKLFLNNVLLFIIIVSLLINVHGNKTGLLYNLENESDVINNHYINDWVVKINRRKNCLQEAEEIAIELGYDNLGPITGFDDTFLFRKKHHARRTKRQATELTKQLINDNRVSWAEQQVAKVRVKREFYNDFGQSIGWDPFERGKKELLPYNSKLFNDELWKYQWYLHDTKNIPTLPRLDLQVKQVWDMGYTGKGVVVSVMDDGIEWNHTDIFPNYDPKASYDTNDNDPNPFPRYESTGSESNSHGTRCAGEIAMVANNVKCGVGIAYNAKIGGIRCLDGDVSDVVEAMSIAYNIDYIDIFSSSWGPSDGNLNRKFQFLRFGFLDGMTVDGPKRMATEAILRGITQGRKGKGCIYVWASGNGGMKGDNCNCDGYASSIYTLSIGSASQQGHFPWYGEKCSSTLAVAYSSGDYTDQKVVTIDLHNKCTIEHTGTSAAAPLAAGIIALVLEANPNLTWRDVQHLVAWTSEFVPLMDNKGWKRNSAGLMYNCRFGFGLMNAEELVKTSLRWKNVPEKIICYVQPAIRFPLKLSSKNKIEVTFLNNNCDINFLEHVQINFNIEYTKRGNLDIFLTSPSETVSMLLSRRPIDTSVLGFRGWNLTSVHFWGENPRGLWKLMIRDLKGSGHRGRLKSVYLILHGTKNIPDYLRKGPRRYKQEDLVKQTLDPTPEYFESDIFDQDNVKNNLNPLNSPSHLDWLSDYIGIPLSKKSNPEINKIPLSKKSNPKIEKIPLSKKSNPEIEKILLSKKSNPKIKKFKF